MNGLAPLMASDRGDWNTPWSIVSLVRQIAPIGLDPCSNAGSIVNAAVAVELGYADGLLYPWTDHGLVYVNPPYGRAIVPWCQRALDHKWRGDDQLVMLLPARTDTKWFQSLIHEASAACFWKGRLTFLGAPASAPFPSCLIYFGDHSERFAHTFSRYGWVV